MFIHLFVCFLSSLEEKKACSSRGLACHDREGVEFEAGVAVRKKRSPFICTQEVERENKKWGQAINLPSMTDFPQQGNNP